MQRIKRVFMLLLLTFPLLFLMGCEDDKERPEVGEDIEEIGEGDELVMEKLMMNKEK